MSDKTPVATLFIHFYDKPVSEFDLPDDIGDVTSAQGLQIGFSYREAASSLTEDDMHPEDPQVYLDNGVMIALAGEILIGLMEARGISMEAAIEHVQNQFSGAMEAIKYEKLSKRLKDVALSVTEPEGEC